MAAESVQTVLDAVVRTPEFRVLLRRGGGVQASDLVRQLGMPLVSQRWSSRFGEPLRPRACLNVTQLAVVQQVVADLRPLLLQGARVASRVVSEVVEAARAAGVRLSPGSAGEKVLVRLRRHVLDHGGLPGPDWDRTVVDELIAAGSTEDWLGTDDFVARYAALWDQEWAAIGAPALEKCPPSRIGLGLDARPPLIGEPGAPCNWLMGTDRSVFDRYALYWRAKSTNTEPDVPPVGHRLATLRDETAAGLDRAAEEVRRAASAYGLFEEPHRAVLEAVYAGASVGARVRRADWDHFTSRCRGLADRPAHELLATAVAAHLDGWTSSEQAHALARRLGPLDVHADDISRAVVRKLWIDLLRRERVSTEVACSCVVSRFLRTAVQKSVPEALAVWAPGRRGALGDEPAQAVDDVVGDAAIAYELARETDTIELLLENPALARAAFGGATGWEDAYRQASAGAPDGALFTVAELAAYIAGHLGGSDAKEGIR